MNWDKIQSLEELDQLLKRAEDNSEFSFALFKHSTRCSISALAKKRLEFSWKGELENVPIYLIDLIANRELSNEIADRFSVRHESPQLILIRNAEVKYHASHLSISTNEVLKHS